MTEEQMPDDEHVEKIEHWLTNALIGGIGILVTGLTIAAWIWP